METSLYTKYLQITFYQSCLTVSQSGNNIENSNEALNSRITKSSYDIDLYKMTSHFELLTQN